MTREPLPLSFERTVPGATIHGSKGMRWVVVRAASGTADEVVQKARHEANEVLDLIAGRHGDFIELDAPETDNLVWWIDGTPRIRLTHVTLLDTRPPRAVIQIKRPDGTVVPEPPLQWHPALRFFRLAYLTKDPIERFRSLYLALESAISSISAKGGSEGEPTWLKRVLRSLTPAPDWLAIDSSIATGTDPVDSLIDKVYKQTRTASFHAKQGHNVLMPVDQRAMSEAAGACAITHRLLHMLAQHAGYRIGGSGFFQGGFRLMTERVLSSASICLSADTAAIAPSDAEFSAAEHPSTKVQPTSVEYDGFLCTLRGVIEKPEQPIARVGLVGEEFPISATGYETILDPKGFGALDLVLGVMMTQQGV